MEFNSIFVISHRREFFMYFLAVLVAVFVWLIHSGFLAKRFSSLDFISKTIGSQVWQETEKSGGASKVRSHKRTYAEVSASKPSTSNKETPLPKKTNGVMQPPILSTATKSNTSDSNEEISKHSYAQVLASTTPKKTSSVGESPNPSTVEETPKTQRENSSVPPAKHAERCKVCHWEGKSLMAHLRNKRLRCIDEYDMVAEREQRAKKAIAEKNKSYIQGFILRKILFTICH